MKQAVSLPCRNGTCPCPGPHKPLAGWLALIAVFLLPGCVLAVANGAYSKLLLNTPDQWPTYDPGKGNYKWVLNERALQNGITYLGSHERLRVALNKLITGQNFTIVTIGGSITAGQGKSDGLGWTEYFTNYMRDHFGQQVEIRNGAVPGTLSAYMSACMNVHVPSTADIVFVEYNQNDYGIVNPPFLNDQRRHYERLLRKLLSLPNKPAVIQLYTYSWLMPQIVPPGNYWFPCDREFDEFSHYYSLPTVSLKACCWHILDEQPVGFWRNASRNKDMTNLGQRAFYLDDIHPDGQTGTRVIAELAVHLLETGVEQLRARPLSSDDQVMAGLPLPEPMIPKNYHTDSERCFIGRLFTSIITRKEGFEWINDHGRKWGMVATQPGSWMEITVDTRAAAQGDTNQLDVSTFGQGGGDQVLVELAYLQSYERMGRASVECLSGCTCQPFQLEGHTTHRSSQLNIKSLYVTQHPQCVIKITVLPDSSSGQNKVKISAMIVREEAGRIEGALKSYHMTIEYVHDQSTSTVNKLFRMLRSRFRRLQAVFKRR